MKQSEEKTLPIGTKVRVGRDVLFYKLREGVVVNVQRGFKHYDEEIEAFVDGGLVTLENNLKSLVIPYELDGETLKIHHREYTRVAKLYDTYYTVRLVELNQLVLFTIGSLTSLAEPSELEQSLIQHLIEHEAAAGSHLPIYLRGTTYAYPVDSYVELQNDKDKVKGFLNTDDEGFKTIYNSEIVLTTTKFESADPLTVLEFNKM